MFRFGFEPLLAHRRHEEERAQKSLFSAQMALRQAQEGLRRVRKERRSSILELQRRQIGKVDPAAITMALHFISQLTDQLEAERRSVVQAQQRVAAKRQALVAAVTRRKMLEKLKEKERKRYLGALNRRETKFMDEVAVNRHARRMP